MSYIGLGSRMLTSSADQSGLNPGNLTCDFTSAVLTVKQAFYEVYSMSVTGLGTTLTTVTVYVNGNVRTTAFLGGNSEWDPSQPILMNPTDEIVFAFSLASSTNPKPAATIWLRYDPAVQPGM